MNEEFIDAVKSNNIGKVKLLLNNLEIDPAVYNNEAIRAASSRGYTGVVELLLNDPRVAPSAFNNGAIR